MGALYTEADIADAAADLATLMAQRGEETDPAWCDALDDMIRGDAEFLGEMLEAVRGPALPLVLPIGLPAPGPRVGRVGW